MTPYEEWMNKRIALGYSSPADMNQSMKTQGNGMFDFEMPTWEGTKDFLGSETFSNTVGALGMGLNAYQNYVNAEETKKQNKRMFDLEKGQIAKQDALREGFQKNYLGR